MLHANIMPGYPTRCEQGVVFIRGPNKSKITITLGASMSQLWGGARYHRDMQNCDGIIHEAGQVTNLSIECRASVMRWTCPTFSHNVTRQKTANEFVAAIADNNLDPHNGLPCMLTPQSEVRSQWGV